jgi:predicted transcriptional regulator
MDLEIINGKIKEKGLKKTWIAEKLGISNTLFSFYITGTRPIPEDVNKKLEVILD